MPDDLEGPVDIAPGNLLPLPPFNNATVDACTWISWTLSPPPTAQFRAWVDYLVKGAYQ